MSVVDCRLTSQPEESDAGGGAGVGWTLLGREGTLESMIALWGIKHRATGRIRAPLGWSPSDKAVPVTDGWGAIETYILVNAILDPLLQLRARTGWMLPGCISLGEARA